jgi:putative acetyltransferase
MASKASEKKASKMKIVVDDLSGPEIARFLDEHVQEMRSITPPESKYALDLDGLRKPEITFWSVWNGDALVGCGAIKRLDADHAEVKSMRTTATRRRSGIALLLLEHIITEAKRMGFTRLSLGGWCFSRTRRFVGWFWIGENHVNVVLDLEWWMTLGTTPNRPTCCAAPRRSAKAGSVKGRSGSCCIARVTGCLVMRCLPICSPMSAGGVCRRGSWPR